jgi:ethanolamine ammonia-lyase large subunit
MDRDRLRQALVLANELKEGDLPVGGTLDPRLRAEARAELAALSLHELTRTPLVDDGVSAALAGSQIPLLPEIARLRLSEIKRIALGSGGGGWISRYRDHLSSESIAVLVKLMSNAELSTLARRVFNPLADPRSIGRGQSAVAIGSPSHFGARIQPNSPGDDEEEILYSVLEGLTYGCGDVILGLNPASDDLETIVRLERLLQGVVERLELPTRYCVLSDLLKQDQARARTRVDVAFQSLAGTSRALVGMVGLDVDGIVAIAQAFEGLYFETGQGSEVTNGCAEGVDMVTLESRTYGLARHIRRTLERHRQRPIWMIVNDVAGFIGPEVFRRPEQLLRACLEDAVMAKLHGLTMGLDVCATFHMGIAPAELQALTEAIVGQAAPAYLMAVAGNADPMLGYLTTSFREHPRLRRRYGRHIAPAMRERLQALGCLDASGSPIATAEAAAALYLRYRQGCRDARGAGAIRAEARKAIARLRERGFDLGYGHGPNYSAPAEVSARLKRIYTHARRALYARLARTVLDTALPGHLRVRSCACDRDDFIAHPAAGERIAGADAARVRSLYPEVRPEVQVVVSDGLNADAVNENLRQVLPPLRQALAGAGCRLGERAIVVENGRVRAGYHIGALLDVDVIVHLIGERPGTGLDTLSAYLTYGREPRGRTRWTPDLDHACTTAVCGIHPRGRRPEAAAPEVAQYVQRMLEEHRSGVGLAPLTPRKAG